jgi:SAM-dependent methyltransferase
MGSLPLESFVTRRISYRFRGQQVKLALSQSLFSSHEVDRGSELLLKSIPLSVLERSASILDLGCGTGVLGICLARAASGSRLWLQDRDALALGVSALNCRDNAIEPAGIVGELGLQGLGETRFDLIVSNIPAKAGEPVHADLVARIARHVSPGGLACLVVIEPLAERIRSAFEAHGLLCQEAERTGSHVVYHARIQGDLEPPSPSADALAPYVRKRSGFSRGGTHYELDAVYDLPEFDTLSYQTVLALETAEDSRVLGRLDRPILVWNPGQGHLPACLLQQAARGVGPRDLGTITLGSRDILQLRASARNAAVFVSCVHAWDPALAAGPFGCIFVSPDDEPHVGWDAYLPGVLRERLEPGGVAVVSAGATFIARLLRSASGLVLQKSRKRAGTRCVLLRKP